MTAQLPAEQPQNQGMNQAYLEQHPEAIQDVEKAHYMALTMNDNETKGVMHRNLAKEKIDSLGTVATFDEAQYEGITEGLASDRLDELRLEHAESNMTASDISRKMADRQGGEASARYDKGQEILGKKTV